MCSADSMLCPQQHRCTRAHPLAGQDFRQCHALIQRIGAAPAHSFPPAHSGRSHHQDLAAQNVQRGLAAKVQQLSATFRKKQRVYMESQCACPSR